MLAPKLRFGAFIAPFHPLKENPTQALERDIELVQWMDRLGYDEAWIGEHHSAGYELIASPEVFIATVAERTGSDFACAGAAGACASRGSASGTTVSGLTDHRWRPQPGLSRGL